MRSRLKPSKPSPASCASSGARAADFVASKGKAPQNCAPPNTCPSFLSTPVLPSYWAQGLLKARIKRTTLSKSGCWRSTCHLKVAVPPARRILMNENDYLKQVAAQAGLQHYPNQGPWGRKSGSAIGERGGYVTVIGTMGDQRGMKVAILLRFKKMENPESVKTALKNAGIKKGKLGAVGNDFVRWEWKYSFAKPQAEEVAKLAA